MEKTNSVPEKTSRKNKPTYEIPSGNRSLLFPRDICLGKPYWKYPNE